MSNRLQENLENLYEVATVAIKEGRSKDAIEPLRQMLALEPLDVFALRMYGASLGEDKQHETALNAFVQAVALEPNDGKSWMGLGAAYAYTAEYERAALCWERALTYAPDMPGAHWNRSMWRLMNGDFAEGWKEYEWGVSHGQRRIRTQIPSWNGKTEVSSLYVWSEQGLGDTLQFLQMLALLREKFPNTRICLEVQKELIPLLAGQEFLSDVMLFGWTDDLSFPVACETHCALMSLPYLLGLRLEDLPAATDYIKAPCAKPFDTSKKRVGLCWKGNPKHGNTMNRDIPEEALLPLAEVEGIQWVCMQHNQLMHPKFKAEPSAFNSWADTANALASLDLLITCDTGTAHLAAAMGIETWLLIAKVQDWRWMLEREDSPWYPSVKLFRQETRGDWTDVIAEVAQKVNPANYVKPIPAKAAYRILNSEDLEVISKKLCYSINEAYGGVITGEDEV